MSSILGIFIILFVLRLEIKPNSIVNKALLTTIISVACAMLLPKFDSIRKTNKYIVGIVTYISLISYSMYLVHLGIVSEIIQRYFVPSSIIQAYTTYSLYWIISILLATILYKYFEKPIMDLRDRKL